MTSRYPGGLIRKNAANTAITGASGVWDLGSQAQAVKNNTWPISGLALPVSGSLRFRSSASAYLNRTPSTNGSGTTFTWSGWIKRGILGGSNYMVMYSAGSGDAALGALFFDTTDRLYFLNYNGAFNWQLISTSVYRDPSAWYHVVAVVDTTQATASNRIRIYVNGVEITAFSTASYPTQNYSSPFFNQTSYTQLIGRWGTWSSSHIFDGYLAEVNFIDGQALTPASFGQTSPITGVWEPIKYTGTYGTNGFYLSLSDTSSIGKDFSGNGNNWTPNNISTANDSTFDLMRDVPTQWAPQSVTDVGGVVRGNYCTLNSVGRVYGGSSNYGSFTNGNLSFTTTANPSHAFGTIAIPTNSNTGFYWEAVCTSMDVSRTYVGIVDPQAAIAVISDGASYGFPWKFLWERSGYFYNTLATDGSADSRGQLGGGYVANDVIMIAIKNGSIWFGKNGSWVLGGDPSINTGYWDNTIDPTKTWLPYVGYNSNWNVNFGQRPFAYTPPTGFKSLCTTNLPTPTIGATTATAANKYFDATLITGTAATQVITNAGGFQPDFVWLKSRTNANNPTVYDAIRGVNRVLYPALTNVEAVGTAQLTAFNSNGFTLGASENANDDSGEASVGWQWNAGGSTVTNTAGSITSQVRANPTAGFSVVTWTGTGTNRPTIGHGLGVAPSMIIEKGRDAGSGPFAWPVQHIGLSSWNNSLFLNTTGAENSGSGGGTAPTSTVYYAAASAYTGENNVRYVAYCFAPVAGFSAFGKYTGNGSTDGPFVYTGFRPRFVMVKNTVDPNNWTIFDSARNTYNILISQIYPTSDAEVTGSSTNGIDFLSNGFKIRSSNNWGNRSSDTIIYMAFAESPFKYSLAR